MFERTHSRSRRGRQPVPRSRRRASARLLPGVLSSAVVLAAIVLLMLSRSDNRLLAQWRVRLLDLSAPLLDIAAIPPGYVQRSLDRITGFYATQEELTRLRAENERLRGIQSSVEALQQQNSQLRALLNSVADPARRLVTGRVVAGNPTSSGNGAILNIGRRKGIDDGLAVMSAVGFVGRTSDTGEESCRVLLITDRASRIPVAVGRDAVEAMAVGDGAPSPALEFLPPDATIGEGDLVVTSGDGGALPRGLQIGLVRKADGGWRIQPHASLDGLGLVGVVLVDRKELASQR
jgi:rod shape-determining protein MreC